ncbi:transcriptional regulator, AsnC family [Parafrankia sp. EAN1pec]|uniref:Lrp/AsnC family transcriptional regulator n=1 Tax=Parafrankia sp. (strain EAN1pec) TaxID=298653 RepID=UPI00015D9E00|nr:transcriptional regulator, AsnC family [Frankia sp. EAN1pec]
MTEPLEIDDLDRGIVERLRVDGRDTNRSIASSLGVGEATVAARLRRLEAANAVHVVALTDMHRMGLEWFAFLLIRVSGRPVLEVASDLSAIDQAIFVNIHSGRFDMICGVLARSRAELARVVGEVVPRVDGVVSVRCELAADVLRFDSSWAALVDGPGRGVFRGPEIPIGAVDSLDLRIIECLQRDARSSNRMIATELDVSEGTVRTRLRRMESEGLVRIRAVSDIHAFGISAAALVGLHVAGGEVAAVQQALEGVAGLVAIIRCLGEFDYMLIVLARDRAALIQTVVGQLQPMKCLRSVETFEYVTTVKHLYTWVRLVTDDEVGETR